MLSIAVLRRVRRQAVRMRKQRLQEGAGATLPRRLSAIDASAFKLISPLGAARCAASLPGKPGVRGDCFPASLKTILGEFPGRDYPE